MSFPDPAAALTDAQRATLAALRETSVAPDAVNGYLASVGTPRVERPARLAALALRPEVVLADLLAATDLAGLVAASPGMEPTVQEAGVELRYAGYVARETALADQMTRLDRLAVPPGFDFAGVRQITHEARERLARVRPATLGQASRLAGVSPADVQVLMVLLRRPAATTQAR